jgi:hypothetical protein
MSYGTKPSAISYQLFCFPCSLSCFTPLPLYLISPGNRYIHSAIEHLLAIWAYLEKEEESSFLLPLTLNLPSLP